MRPRSCPPSQFHAGTLARRARQIAASACPSPSRHSCYIQGQFTALNIEPECSQNIEYPDDMRVNSTTSLKKMLTAGRRSTSVNDLSSTAQLHIAQRPRVRVDLLRFDEDDDNDPHSSSDDVADTGRLLPWPIIFITCSPVREQAINRAIDKRWRYPERPVAPRRAHNRVRPRRAQRLQPHRRRGLDPGRLRGNTAAPRESAQYRVLAGTLFDVYIQPRYNSLAALPSLAWRECI